MKITKVLLSFFILASLVKAMEPIKSKYDFNTTYENTKKLLTQKNIPIFAEFDHSKNAKDVGLELNATKVIVFGNPKVGTFLMQENPKISMELPLRISIWEDTQHNTYIAYTDIKELAKKYAIKNNQIVENIHKLLEEIIKTSAK
ncbi:DUF302 domain-containing protein [Helicobacter mesocricetorum]|uniref:DUF302 domain-containing protein n=1 Tax=Helicobacter mesocricetorum TaxID=87012 RepID=UPI000CF14D4D|nr:DUF302 domain-containing protein [Helicobacter mesocricetorum]